VRSGLFQAFSEWSAQRVEALPEMHERAWKPNRLVPVTNPAELPGSFDLLRDFTYPKGSLILVKFTQDWEQAME
jgi:solute carrier family 12 sodium/potassium/chloride transporter 2